MHKLMAISMVCATICVGALQGCNGCVHTFKNIESNVGDLTRDITVMNAFTGDTIFRYSGPCYFETNPSEGITSLIYKVDGTSKKADFIGNFVFTAVEK